MRDATESMHRRALRCTTSSTHVNNNAFRNPDAFIVCRCIEMALRLLRCLRMQRLVGLQSEKDFRYSNANVCILMVRHMEKREQ
jgi:hypothetical protein